MQFHEKNLIYLISRVFLPGLFKIFWPAVRWSTLEVKCVIFVDVRKKIKCDICGKHYDNMTMSEKSSNVNIADTII